jgi:2-haloacid dehalogenase
MGRVSPSERRRIISGQEGLVSRVCVFDVNETLLDLAALDPHFERVFGDRAVRKAWFQQLLQSAMVTIITDRYVDFSAIGRAALDMTAERRGIQLSDEDRTRILGTVRELPPHPDVRDGLERLRAAGLRLATLTNNTAQTAQAQMDNAGLRDYFEQILSADEARRLKPAREPYHYAAQQLGVDISQIRWIAAHAWDVAGAQRAGCAVAFIARPDMVLDPLFERPDVVGRDLREVAAQIIQRETGS